MRELIRVNEYLRTGDVREYGPKPGISPVTMQMNTK
jgi:hypothetical protein